MAGFMMAVPVGVMLSFTVSGPVAQAYGWRMAMAVAAAPAALLIPALLLLREPARSAAKRVRTNPLALLRNRAFAWIAVSGALVNFVLYSFSTFISAFLTRYHGLPVGEAGVWAGLGSGVAGILGAVAAGVWGDRVRGQEQADAAASPRAGMTTGTAEWGIRAPGVEMSLDAARTSACATSRLQLAAGAALLACVPAFFGLSMRTAGWAAILLMGAYGLLQMYYGLIYAAIQDLVPAEQRGSAMAVYLMAMYLCGGAFGPLVTGRVSDFLARQAADGGPILESARAAGLHGAMYLVPVLSIVLAGVLWTAARAAR
jgi:MFS family permease